MTLRSISWAGADEYLHPRQPTIACSRICRNLQPCEASRGSERRWHTEMANLNSIARTLIRLMYGATLPAGTHREALEHYRIASRLAPARMIHR